MTSTKKLLALMAAPILLSGCEGLLALDSAVIIDRTSDFVYGAVSGQEVNINAKSYAAADYLAHHIKTFISRKDLIKAVPLYGEKSAEGKITEISTVVPYQVGLRLAQLGYQVDLSQVSPTKDAATSDALLNKARFILSGTFKRQPFRMHVYRDVDVTINVTDTRSGKVIATFDYVLPRNLEVQQLSAVPDTEEEVEEREETRQLQEEEKN